MLRFLDPSRNRYAGLLFAACVLCGPLALVVAGWAGWNAHSKQPPPVASYVHLNTVTNQVELFADQLVRLSLTGSGEQDRKTLATMVVDPRAVSLAETPWNVTSTHLTTVKRVAEEADSAEWEAKIRVGYSVPGSGVVQFGTMVVSVLSSNGAYKATALPRFENSQDPAMEVGPGYTIAVDPHASLGVAVASFANAYYVQGPNQDLGRLVTGTFSGKPLRPSPFTSTDVKMIFSKRAVPIKPSPGDTVEVLATIRGGASEKTWYTMQVPLRMTVTDQRQWAVSAILDSLDVGKIIHQ
ncbi:conjugal transfer protein [Mycobacterium intracellulare]|uniref:conjugal transfer protein n=1 Tax=Mycobacterium intracellulare TaxID=1767 RepID=UPI001EEF4E20|nr:conjugal transfer protein [Mycobacterium intracellulare]MEE3755273.1 conjugal transfer protein [Mycobacterium intracellulare]